MNSEDRAKLLMSKMDNWIETENWGHSIRERILLLAGDSFREAQKEVLREAIAIANKHIEKCKHLGKCSLKIYEEINKLLEDK